MSSSRELRIASEEIQTLGKENKTSDPDLPRSEKENRSLAGIEEARENSEALDKTDNNELQEDSTVSRKHDKAHVPWPPNSIFVFASEYAKGNKGRSTREILPEAGALRMVLLDKDEQVWKDRAAILKVKHAIDHPGYRYQPKLKNPRRSRQNQIESALRVQGVTQSEGKAPEYGLSSAVRTTLGPSIRAVTRTANGSSTSPMSYLDTSQGFSSGHNPALLHVAPQRAYPASPSEVVARKSSRDSRPRLEESVKMNASISENSSLAPYTRARRWGDTIGPEHVLERRIGDRIFLNQLMYNGDFRYTQAAAKVAPQAPTASDRLRQLELKVLPIRLAFQCRWPGCTRSFNNLESLIRHKSDAAHNWLAQQSFMKHVSQTTGNKIRH